MDIKEAIALAVELDGGSYMGIMEQKDTGQFRPTIRMRRSGYTMLDHFQQLIPGNRSQSITKDTGSTEYWINWVGAKAYKVLDVTSPFLKKKQAHAILMLEFREILDEYRRKHGKHGRITDEQRALRREFAAKIRALNSNPENRTPGPITEVIPHQGEYRVAVPRETDPYDGNHLNPYIADEVGQVKQPPAASSDQEEIKSIFD